MTHIDTSNLKRVGLEQHHEIEQFLFQEARMLDTEQLREWLTSMLDPEISYQMVVCDERFRKDKAPVSQREVPVYHDNQAALDMRIRQFESGLQTMHDPAQRMRRFVSNVTAYHGEKDGEFVVLSYGFATRFRRLYENEQTVYGRTDLLRRDADGNFRLVTRRIDLDERVIRNKNLLFFL